jgi:hypothetical protein
MIENGWPNVSARRKAFADAAAIMEQFVFQAFQMTSTDRQRKEVDRGVEALIRLSKKTNGSEIMDLGNAAMGSKELRLLIEARRRAHDVLVIDDRGRAVKST